MNTEMTKVMAKEEKGRVEDISISRTVLEEVDSIVTWIENRKNSNNNKGIPSRLKAAGSGYQNV